MPGPDDKEAEEAPAPPSGNGAELAKLFREIEDEKPADEDIRDEHHPG